MERALPRPAHSAHPANPAPSSPSGLHRSELLGLLAQMGVVDGQPTPPSFVAGLGRWLGWKEAISLSAVLQTAPAAVARAPTPAAALERELGRVRAALLHTMQDDSWLAQEAGTDFDTVRRRYGAVQQAMASAVGALRVQARAAVAAVSPAMGRLAAIDAVMAQTLGGREQALLGLVPTLLERHHTRLPATGVAGDTSTEAGAGLKALRQDMQRLWLAELDLRLQPVLGLLEALRGH